MTQVNADLSTGMPGLDRVLAGLIPGDNLVYQVAGVQDYQPFAAAFIEAACAGGRRPVYVRFARHEPLVAARPGLEVVELDPQQGFEPFVTAIHKTVERFGRNGSFLFDLLSDLAADWFSDTMLANWFVLTCPYVYDLGGLATFALLQDRHAPETVATITQTAQVVMEVFAQAGTRYLHPLKVQQRYSPTMYMLHECRDGDFKPVSESATIAEVMTARPWAPWAATGCTAGTVDRLFDQAARLVESAQPAPDAETLRQRLLRTILSRDERVLALAGPHFDLADLLRIRRRMVGTGLIGGKTVGMLLARAILAHADARWRDRLEPHDSFYIGSDVYYTFVVRNGLYWVRERQKDPRAFLDGAEQARQRMLVGTFPDHIRQQLAAMLEYFGQSPIIVRSSSLLEDNFGNAFAGKYDSVFLANQGPPAERLENLVAAIRTIYASTMGEPALSYRAQRGLLGRDEQMALLVQRVSGADYGEYHYPHLAGVALSYNPYAWSSYIDPAAGMVRLVFGLGTRAVDRCDDDYTRIVALNAPERRPETGIDQVRRYAQRKVDVIALRANQVLSVDFITALRQAGGVPMDLFASREAGESAASAHDDSLWYLSFDRLLGETTFITDLRALLATLQQAYDYPVDVEFAANFRPDGGYRINLLQCRPLQVKGGGALLAEPAYAPVDEVLAARGAVIGQSRIERIDRVVWVGQEAYVALPLTRRYGVARLVGRLCHLEGPRAAQRLLLVGPGRWGTSSPSLGVPVRFPEINRASVLCEVVAMHEGLIPDVSLGTHFFNELVEQEMLYCALFPGREGNRLDAGVIAAAPNRLADLLPDAAEWAEVVRVVDVVDLPGASALIAHADTLRQQVTVYLQR